MAQTVEEALKNELSSCFSHIFNGGTMPSYRVRGVGYEKISPRELKRRIQLLW